MSPVVLFCRIVREMRVDEVSWVRQEVEIVLLWQELASGTVVTSCSKQQNVKNYSKVHEGSTPVPKNVAQIVLLSLYTCLKTCLGPGKSPGAFPFGKKSGNN
jgi:hypothetical protein